MSVLRSEHCGREDRHDGHNGRGVGSGPGPHLHCNGDPEHLSRQREREANPPPGPPSPPSRTEWDAAPSGCPKWPNGEHNEITIKGWLPWRRYAVCCSCGHERRIR